MHVSFLFLILAGAHLNPAFSLAMCLLGRLPWAKLPIYSLVQLLSAFCASGATYVLYYGNRGNTVGGTCVWAGVPWNGLDEQTVGWKSCVSPSSHRCPTELYKWEPDSDWPQGDGLHLCHLPCPLSVPEQWLPGSGRCEGETWEPQLLLCPMGPQPIIQALGGMFS